jgi:hypothetical protein
MNTQGLIGYKNLMRVDTFHGDEYYLTLVFPDGSMQDFNIGEAAYRSLIEQGKVRFLREILPYTGLDNQTFGPFKVGEIAILPKEEAVWLVKEKLAELVRK